MEIFVAILVFIAIIIIAALVFGGWMIVAVVRMIGSAIGGGMRQYDGPRAPTVPSLTRCDNAGCLTDNPRRARFCRRCGRVLGFETGRAVRRVAAL